MCGISGIYNKNRLFEKQKASIEKMNEAQLTRGPDDSGIFVDPESRVALGHQRLAILDLSDAGRQPMTSADGQLTITFNGEIYNFKELRSDLERSGYIFKTETDTEVILLLYQEFGEKSFGMLKGMFAFGLWDNTSKKLFLVKDRYGIKPLYYYHDEEKLVFASTVTAIEKSGLIYVEKNLEASIGFLLFGFVPLPITTLKNVFGIMPGHYLVISEDGRLEITQYYDPLDFFQSKKYHSMEEATGQIRLLLTKSMQLHLISDVPFGILLSGGLDSSAIAMLAARQEHRPVNTLSVVFKEEEFSERKYQRLVAKKIGSSHFETTITQQDFFDSLDDIFAFMDQPTIDGVNTYFIAKAAKQAGLKTVLSGTGADEIFCGYGNAKKAIWFRKVQKMPKLIRLLISLLSALGGRYSKLQYLKHTNPLHLYLSIRGLFMPKEVARTLNIERHQVVEFIDNISATYKLDSAQSLHPIDLLAYLELKFYLQSQLLKDIDCMSMRHSVEVRVPFLDHELVEYVSGLSSKMKFGGRVNKSLLVASTGGMLPKEVGIRPKMGFIFPFQKWFCASLSTINKPWTQFWAHVVLSRYNKK